MTPSTSKPHELVQTATQIYKDGGKDGGDDGRQNWNYKKEMWEEREANRSGGRGEGIPEAADGQKMMEAERHRVEEQRRE